MVRMKKKILTCLMVGLFGLAVSAQFAFAGATPEEAKALVEKAEAYFLANGKDKALKEFNDPKRICNRGSLHLCLGPERHQHRPHKPQTGRG